MSPALPAEKLTLLSPVQSAVLHTLMYFDIFRHPLTIDEIHRNCQWKSCGIGETATALEELQQLNIVNEQDGFWFLGEKKTLVALRSEREQRAVHFTKKAKQYSSLIAGFPFVRGVAISGSLSKGTMDRDGDIDYFIITEPGRLWIARTLLVLFKKIFLLNSRKYFCVNYFVDTDHLSIPDRNLFVATEIVHLRPMKNAEMHDAFFEANKWTELFYPNRKRPAMHEIPALRSRFSKRMLEKLFSGNFGDWLDERFLRVTLKRWKKKFAGVPGMHFDVDFRSRRHVSKHHPQGFQRRVSAELEKRRNELLDTHGLSVPVLRWEWTREE